MITIIKKGTSDEEIKKRLSEISKKWDKRKGFNAFEFCGAVKFAEDALIIQKKLRDEWR